MFIKYIKHLEKFPHAKFQRDQSKFFYRQRTPVLNGEKSILITIFLSTSTDFNMPIFKSIKHYL